mgnify:CR=1 FL=1
MPRSMREEVYIPFSASKRSLMHPIHDIDVLVLLALALSSKRRPAQLVEVITAAEIVQHVIPANLRLIESFSRLAKCGLICAMDSGFTLTSEAQTIMANPSRTNDTSRRIASIKEKLASYEAKSEHAPILLSAKEVSAAILAHRALSRITGNRLLATKAPAQGANARPGQRQRKPHPARRVKD